MKWPAVLVLATLLLTVAIQPIGELANILKEKVVLNSALLNSCRAAQNNAINTWYLMNLDAYINEGDFMQLFSDAFSQSLNLTHNYDRNTTIDNRVTFTSNDGRFNPIIMEFDLRNTTFDELGDEDLSITGVHNRPVTLVTVTMETPYLFRTYWLRQANGALNDDYLITDARRFLIQIIN